MMRQKPQQCQSILTKNTQSGFLTCSHSSRLFVFSEVSQKHQLSCETCPLHVVILRVPLAVKYDYRVIYLGFRLSLNFYFWNCLSLKKIIH